MSKKINIDLVDGKVWHYISARNLKWMNDPEVTRYLTKREKTTFLKALLYFRRCQKNKDILYAIYADGEHVGNCGFFNLSDESAELRIMIGERNLWGKGVGTLALLKMLLKSDALGISRIWLTVTPDNLAAYRLYEKNGFVEKEKILRPGSSSLVKMEFEKNSKREEPSSSFVADSYHRVVVSLEQHRPKKSEASGWYKRPSAPYPVIKTNKQ